MSSTSLDMPESEWALRAVFIFPDCQISKFGAAAEISGIDGNPGDREFGGVSAAGAAVVNKLTNFGNNVLNVLYNWLSS